MTKAQRDIPTHEGMTVADRLKIARQNARFTRKKLSEETGIPYSTIEKYERGDMDPNTTRLQTICEELGITVGWVLSGEGAEQNFKAEKFAENQASEDDRENSSEGPHEPSTEATEVLADGQSMRIEMAILRRIDGLREEGFAGAQRSALALVDDAKKALQYMEPVELLALASKRGLHDGGIHTAEFLDGLFLENQEEAKTHCMNIEERILDTAILGIDLYNIERESLVNFVDTLSEENADIQPQCAFGFSWGEHDDFVPLIRGTLRNDAFAGRNQRLQDHTAFPRRNAPVNPASSPT